MNAALWRNMTPSERECWHWAEGTIGIEDPDTERACVGNTLAASTAAADELDEHGLSYDLTVELAASDLLV